MMWVWQVTRRSPPPARQSHLISKPSLQITTRRVLKANTWPLHVSSKIPLLPLPPSSQHSAWPVIWPHTSHNPPCPFKARTWPSYVANRMPLAPSPPLPSSSLPPRLPHSSDSASSLQGTTHPVLEGQDLAVICRQQDASDTLPSSPPPTPTL